MEEAEQHGWTADKLVIPITSIVLQDVYFIKTHSEDYTAEGGINLKVEMSSLLEICHDHEYLYLQKYYSMAKCIAEEFLSCKQSKVRHCFSNSPSFCERSVVCFESDALFLIRIDGIEDVQ